ncbi:unnamed protein product [Parascedosporium putredinis]|uniref:3-hydroxyisobutyrate dehydrogenase n=1 Tax=Parascedosporium putredinis TaxID=1442378 RepID=A0A9P1MAJ8_9PEZI|nr:unnamed protein product [Parascedosporium putredinis]CAI7996747.1 unnamed protein product [Parascedosporium putredinis]
MVGIVETTTYGFIGLGQMGHGMAKNICLKAPETSLVIVYDIATQATQRLASEFKGQGRNIQVATSPKEDVIFTSVPQAAHVRDVFLNPSTGLLAAPKKEGRRKLYLELSTIDVAVSSEVAAAVVDGGFGDFVDAPCSGGAMGAETGNLSFMIGCPDNLYPRVLELCKLMGKEESIFHCGNLGAGLKTKLLNNYLSSLTALATAETFNIGIRAGLDAKTSSSNGYNGGFSIELCLGVLELAVKAGEDLGATMPIGKPMLEAYRQVAADVRFKGKDSKAIYKWIGGSDPDLGEA